MSTVWEKRALVLLLVSGGVLVIGAAVERNWIVAAMWVALAAWAGAMLRRLSKASAS